MLLADEPLLERAEDCPAGRSCDGRRERERRGERERLGEGVRHGERARLPAEDDASGEPATTTAEAVDGAVKLFINRGKQSGIGESELRWALTEGAVIPSQAIGSIRVLERFSFVELPGEHAELALERLDGTKLGGKQIRVEYARD